MKSVILAGGLGERLRPFTEAIPKPLLPTGEQSLLESQISNLAKHGFSKAFIAKNYGSEYISCDGSVSSRSGLTLTRWRLL